MDKKKYSTLLIWSAALISIVRYAGAFMASDMGAISGKPSEVLTVFMGITGIGMGLLDSIGTAFLFNGWRLAMPRTGDRWKLKFKILTMFVFLLVFTGLAILTPYTVSRVAHLSVWEVLGEQGTWIWSLFVNLSPVLIIGGVMSGNANLVTDANESRTKLSETYAEPEISKVKTYGSWRNIRHQLTYEQLVSLAQMSTRDIQDIYGLEERTAQNWRQYAQEELRNR